MDWTQFGLAGTIATSLGAVIAYIFRLLITSQNTTIERLVIERNAEKADNSRLHDKFDEQQRTALTVLSDVTHVLTEVQHMLREREIRRNIQDDNRRE